MEFQKYFCEDTLIMECGISGDDLDMKDELTKIKHKLLNEIQKTHNALRNVKCDFFNGYIIKNDKHTVDTLRMTTFGMIHEKDILKKIDELFNDKINYLLERHKSDIEEFKGEHKDTSLKEMSYSKVINRSFNVIIAMNNKRNNWFLNLFRDIF